MALFKPPMNVSTELTSADLTSSNVSLLNKTGATYTKLQDWTNAIQSSGRVFGGVITAHAPADGTVDISVLKGFIKVTTSDIAETRFFDMASTTISLTDNYANYIYVDYNSGSPSAFATTDRSTINNTTQFTLGRAFRSGTVVDVLNSGINLYNRTRLTHEKWIDTFSGVSYASGLTVTCTGLKPAYTAGVMYAGSNKLTIDALDCNTSGTFTAYYTTDNGSTWTTQTSQTDLNATQYNDVSTGLTTLSNNQYGVHWLYICPNGCLAVLYGKGSYTLAQAQAVAAPVSPIPNYLAQWAKLAAKVIILKSATSVYSITHAWATQFPVQSPGDHNSLAGLQGGTSSEYYHLTSEQYNELSTFATIGDIPTDYGDVIGPEGATAGNLPLLDVTGKILSDSTYTPNDFATVAHIHTDLYPIDTTAADVFTKTLTETSDDYGGTTLEVRCVIPATDINGSGNCITITLKSGSTQSLVLNSVYIVERDGNTPNGTTLPTQVTFSNYFNSPWIWITSNTTAVSDLIEFDIDDTKDYLVILYCSGLNDPMRAEGYTYYSTTTADPDAKDMADPSPQTANYLFCVSTINAYTRHKVEFKSGSLYEVNGELTLDGDVLLTGAFDGTSSTTFKIANGEGEYAPEFIYTSPQVMLKLINANNFRLDGDNNNTNTYNLYTGSSCVNISASTSNALDRFMLDEYLGNGYAYWDYAIANNGTRSFEEWNTNNIEYDKHCSGNIVYDIYTTGGASNRGIELAFATDSSPIVKVYTSETDCATITPSTITLAGKTVPRYHESATTAPETDIAAGDEYWNTGDSKFYKYNGSNWIALN